MSHLRQKLVSNRTPVLCVNFSKIDPGDLLILRVRLTAQVAAAEDLHIDPAELDTVIAIASGTVMPNPQIALFAALQRCPATPAGRLHP